MIKLLRHRWLKQRYNKFVSRITQEPTRDLSLSILKKITCQPPFNLTFIKVKTLFAKVRFLIYFSFRF